MHYAEESDSSVALSSEIDFDLVEYTQSPRKEHPTRVSNSVCVSATTSVDPNAGTSDRDIENDGDTLDLFPDLRMPQKKQIDKRCQKRVDGHIQPTVVNENRRDQEPPVRINHANAREGERRNLLTRQTLRTRTKAIDDNDSTSIAEIDSVGDDEREPDEKSDSDDEGHGRNEGMHSCSDCTSASSGLKGRLSKGKRPEPRINDKRGKGTNVVEFFLQILLEA